MKDLRIAVLDDYQNVARRYADWDSLDAEVEVFHRALPDADTVVSELAGFDVVVAMRERTRFPADVLRRLPRLRLLVTTGPVNAAIDVPAAAAQGIVVCRTGYPDAAGTAELTWALILAAVRNLPAETRHVREGGWQTGVGTMLAGKTLGLLGLGRLGSRVARVGQAFDMETIAWSQNLTAGKAAEHGVRAVTKEQLFTRSDVVSIHLVLSERSRGLVGEAELSSMKPTALLVNTSRGPIVDQDALVDALRRRKIGAAALDVFDAEPLPEEHPLRTLENALVTPHIGYVTEGNYQVFYRDAVENIAAFVAGEPIRVLRK
ncbi:MAG: D-2-hydroxyacid dehydrogenase family protein [Streptomyces sp.]|uniref:D-2-hydroxyacid dehydrogenase family protein n=1 Tax=Streptomyces sp. TaxID=1931 RepID=UPI0025F6147E|nr:D-2-hydroxyacid dehydrogenase family protein [Streptomyces sp.]MBW8800293.1 D-2-hydroxyacid dehydrogenase family protein [Streptomyces sp.]